MFAGLSVLNRIRDVKRFIELQTLRLRGLSRSSPSDDLIRRFIAENTEVVVGESLTPELKLRLFTPKCRFWSEKPDVWPFDDPYWAIYWPGGQALSRSDNKFSSVKPLFLVIYFYHVPVGTSWIIQMCVGVKRCWMWAAAVEPPASLPDSAVLVLLWPMMWTLVGCFLCFCCQRSRKYLKIFTKTTTP